MRQTKIKTLHFDVFDYLQGLTIIALFIGYYSVRYFYHAPGMINEYIQIVYILFHSEWFYLHKIDEFSFFSFSF